MQQSVFRFILSVLKPFRWLLAGHVLVGFIWAIDVSLRPYLLKTMLDRMQGLAPADAFTALLGPVLLYITMSLVMICDFRLYDFIVIKTNAPLRRHIGIRLMDCMMAHSHQLYQEHFAGALGNRIKEVMSGIPSLFRIIVDHLLSQVFSLIIAMGTMWTVSAVFALALGVWVTIYILLSLWLSVRAHQLSESASLAGSDVMGGIVDTLGNMMTVRLFGGEKKEHTTLTEIFTSYVRAEQKRGWFFFKMFFAQGISFVIYQGACLLWLVQGYHAGYVTAGDFALIVMINVTIVDSLWSLSRDFGNIAELAGNITHGLRIALASVHIEDNQDAHPLVVKQGEIVFENVNFRYKGSGLIFEEKSVIIPSGQNVGLVGYSGSGKTTFVNLMLRLFDVTSGRILIDGQDISQVTQASLRAAIGVIPQDPILFHRSLLENIRYGKFEATDAQVILAAKRAHAHEFIMALPEGYDSLVGERGVKLSGGQRQRIAIARAILKNAPILIFDEATSQLDSVTEGYIQESLAELMQGKTTLVIAHRLSTLLSMDRILVFDQGEIVQDGTHDELVSVDGLYKILWDAQVGGLLPGEED